MSNLGGEESWDALKPETERQQEREGRITSPDREREREREWEFMDVGLPICTSKSWHSGGCVNLWWNHSITLMNVHTYHQHTACADSSFTDVSVLRQTGNRASFVRSEKLGGELLLTQRLHVALGFPRTQVVFEDICGQCGSHFLLLNKSRPVILPAMLVLLLCASVHVV